MPVILSAATLVVTFLGGMVALRLRDRLYLIVSFAAGAVIGVAFFDLLPEALSLSGKRYPAGLTTSLVAAGFVAYMLLHGWATGAGHGGEACVKGHRGGQLGAGTLSVHSFMDGIGIGLGFRVSTAVGLIIATGVLVHDFSDGINTVGIILKGAGSAKLALRWLILDAVAPVLGAVATLFFHLPGVILGLVLAVFCGFFLYLGAADLLPESHRRGRPGWSAALTVLGIAVLYAAVRLANAEP